MYASLRQGKDEVMEPVRQRLMAAGAIQHLRLPLEIHACHTACQAVSELAKKGLHKTLARAQWLGIAPDLVAQFSLPPPPPAGAQDGETAGTLPTRDELRAAGILDRHTKGAAPEARSYGYFATHGGRTPLTQPAIRQAVLC